MIKTAFLTVASALLVVMSHAGSACASDPVDVPAAPYCPPFAVSADQQEAIFHRFVDGFLLTGNPRQALVDHIADDYIQHNPGFLSGKDVVLGAFSGDLSAFGIVYPANIINRSFDAKRNTGMVHYYFNPAAGQQPSVVVDIFRMNGSCIQEHWDVIQERPANATNPLAMF